ncbi:MAG TPA: hypothetical protein VM032_17010 [Vicinamibacterales bacterium]|nr:hypothetical protein [Vicinamibacterales bacterium]
MTRGSGTGLSWRGLLSLHASVAAIAVTVWLVPASIHIVNWPASGPTRLALLAPTWQLLLWMGAAVAAAGVIVVSGHSARATVLLRPFLVLWAGVVPYLPWLPDRLPLLLLLAGPVRWAVLAATMARAAWIWRGRSGLVDSARVGRRGVFALSFGLYVGFGLWSVTTNGLGGDEPHYLVITESLLRDGDLQIENNHQRGDYRGFFRGDLRPDYMQRGQNGQIYSIHAPGLPAVLLPIYAVAGHLGAVAFMALLAALTSLAIFDLAGLMTGRTTALFTWVGVGLTVPFVPHSWAIFPEMPGALLAAWAALWLLQPAETPTVARWFARGAALALLPWLHTKFIVLLAIFSLGLGLRLLRKPARLAALASPIAVSCALWLYSFYALYGRFDPEAPYGAYSRVFVLTSNIPHGLLGLFFDQKFGLLVYSPLYVIALAGAWFGLRDPRFRFGSIVLMVIVAAFVGSTARLYMFWGGSSAPARFFVPVLPCLAPFIALAIEHARSAASRAVVGLWLAIGVGVAAVGTVSPERLMLFSDPHGRARLLELLQAGSPLASVVPTFTDPDWATQVMPLTLWLAAALVAIGVLALAARTVGGGPWPLAAVVSAAFLLAGSVVTARPPAAVRDATATRGDLEVLWRFDGDRFRTLDYQTLARATPDRLRELTTVRLRPAVPADATSPFETAPLSLPPGVFDASVWFDGTRPRDGAVSVADPRATFGSVAGALGNPAQFRVTIPATTRRTQVRVPDLQVARAIREIQLAPREVVPPPARDPRPVRLIESVRGRADSYLVYTDDEAYPEMGTFWSRGTAATTVLVAGGGASRMVLTLSTGPRSGAVRVAAAGQVQQVAMVANEEQSIAFDLPAGERLVALTVQSSVMFRPGEVNPDLRDMRGLGCQVSIALE